MDQQILWDRTGVEGIYAALMAGGKALVYNRSKAD